MSEVALGIAAITASDSYLGAVAIVMVCGFISAAIAYALAPERLVGWKWLGSVLLVYTILLVPKVTVGIVDKLGTQPVQVVGNVPFGAAIFGHLADKIGRRRLLIAREHLAEVHERADLGRGCRAHRLYLRHHRQAEGDDAFPPRRGRHV